MNHRTISRISRLFGAVACACASVAGWAQPVCSIQIDNDTTICQGETVTLHGPPSYTNYLWSTGEMTQDITVGSTGAYWCEVSYPTGNMVTNGTFSAGNNGFTSMFTYQLPLTNDGNYWIGNSAFPFHNQWIGTGNGPFLLVNAGWMHSGWRFWCQTLPVCPGQTYDIQFRAVSLAAQGNPTLAVFVNNVWTGVDHITSPVQGQWQVFNTTYTAPPGVTSADFCVQVSSGHGVGNDIGFDDVEISSTVVLRDTAVVTVTPLPSFDLGPNATLCDGQSLLLDVSVPGGTYLWQDGSTADSYTVTGPGNYNVTVTANNCSASDAMNISYNPLPPLDLGPDRSLCDGETAILDATLAGATYLWQDGSNGPTFTVSGPGTYSVGVQLNGCSSTDAVNVTYNPLPVVNLGPDLSFCAGQQATLDASMPGATYLWSDGSTNPTLTVSNAGTYSVDVTVGGCTSSDAADVSVIPLPVVDIGPDQMICPGAFIGLDAATPGATYLWSDGSTGATLVASAAGNYSVQVTVNGCAASDAMTLSHHALPVFDLGLDQTICAGGSATFSANVAGASYLWSTGTSANSIQASTAGSYWLDLTTNGCTVRDSVQLFVTPLPVVSLGNDYSLCPGLTTTLDATAAGGSYLWSTGAMTPSIIVGPGNYAVEVTVNGCSSLDAIVVGAFPAAQVDLGGDVTLCPGDVFMLSAAQAGASYLWHDGSTGPTYLIQTGGAISVQLTDANGCVATDAITATYAAPAPIDLGPDETICMGDAVILDATVPGASYLWSTGAQSPTITVSTAGNYSVVVTQGSCTVSDAITVTTIAAPAFDLGPDQTLCTGDAITLDATVAGGSYQWSTGEQTPTITVNQGGAYAVTVTNAAGCSAADAVSIIEATPDAIDLGADLSLCQGQSAVLDATLPGAAYLWSTGAIAPTLTVSTPGTYWVTATQGNCTVSDTVIIAVQPVPMVNLGNDQTFCDGTSATLDATYPGAAYSWSTGATSPAITVSASGNYSVTVDLNGCTATDAVGITVVTPATFDLGPDLQLCSGDQVVFALGVTGADILWSTGSTTSTITVANTTTVWVQVTQGPCVTSDTVQVFVLNPGAIDLGPDITGCAGDPVVLDATLPGATYLWSNGATSAQLNVTASGTYSVIATVAQCTASDQVEVTINPLPVVEIGGDQSICPGFAASFNATTPGASYLWQDGSTAPTYTTAAQEPVSVTVTVNGCSVTDQAQVTVLPLPIVHLGNDTTICEGASLLLDAQLAGATYQWSDGSSGPNLLVTDAGTYQVLVDLNGCTATDAINVAVFSPAALDLGPNQLHCPGEVVTLATGVIGSHLWSTGATSNAISLSTPGSYWVQVQVAACMVSDTVVIDYVPLVTPDLGGSRVLCAGDTAWLAVDAGAASILWSTGGNADSIAVATTGDYGVTLSLLGCTTTDAIQVRVLEWVDSISLGTDSTYCPDAPLVLDVTTPGASYLWSTGATSSSITVQQEGVYTVQLSGPCIDAAAAMTVTEGVCDPMIHVPNAFTPNGDGINDVFGVSFYGPHRDYALDIFDRWGERIVSYDDPMMTWDGTVGGSPVPDGVYVWKIRYRASTDQGARARELIGHVTVLR
ncbi:MAG: gliding motility-associated C-terminal domain-containing protein [Flavobacteriales bacterium]|nr:gliding motility-associated C-terminal domain-containing protein [Flavobacteriales bacterium]